MKRILSLILALMLVSSLAACGGKTPAEDQPNPPQETTTPSQAEEDAASSPAVMFLKDFMARAETAESMETLANDLVSNDWVPFAGAAMAVEPGYLNGFSTEITGFAEGAMFGPLIGSIPFIGYVFRLDNGADVNGFMKTLEDNADLRWNICTQADELVTEASGNTVFFVMAPASFED